MRTALLLTAAAICLQAHAQFPFFLQEHSGNNINYAAPVDMEFDGSSQFYSLHYTNPGPGAMIAQYSATSGNVLNAVYLTRGNATIKPVRIRTLGTNYYVLFNSVSGANVSGFCLVSINAGSHTVNWARAFAAPTGAATRNAVDFILDGGSFAYILSNAYDAVNNQNDIGVTAVDITTMTLSWDNVYQNTARTEAASNIVFRAASNELIVSAISADLLNPTIDRGPMLMRVSPGGGYLASMLYEYAPGCTHAEPNGTWVGLGPNNFYLSSTSLENGFNGPLWLSKINPASLGINIQTNHQTNTVYLNPEFQFVLAGTGPHVLLSGSSPGASGSGYVHTEFTTSALAFAQGTIYPMTNPQPYGSPMFDAYNTTGTGLNIFSVAENAATSNSYYLMKTSDVGRNDCDHPYQISPDQCQMVPLGISFTQQPVALIVGAPSCATSFRSNTITQPCYVPFLVAPDNGSREIAPAAADELVIFPNPAKGTFTISAGNSILSNVKLQGTDGKEVPTDISNTTEGIKVNLTDKKSGVYLVQLLVDGEPKTMKVVLE